MKFLDLPKGSCNRLFQLTILSTLFFFWNFTMHDVYVVVCSTGECRRRPVAVYESEKDAEDSARDLNSRSHYAEFLVIPLKYFTNDSAHQ